MKTGTGTTTNRGFAHATAQAVVEPVPVFISPGTARPAQKRPRIVDQSGLEVCQFSSVTRGTFLGRRPMVPPAGHRPRCTTHVKDPSGLVPLVNTVGWLRQTSAKTTDPHVLVTWVKKIGAHARVVGTSFTVRTSRTGSGCALRFGGSIPTSFTARTSRTGSDSTCVVQRGRCLARENQGPSAQERAAFHRTELAYFQRHLFLSKNGRTFFPQTAYWRLLGGPAERAFVRERSSAHLAGISRHAGAEAANGRFVRA